MRWKGRFLVSCPANTLQINDLDGAPVCVIARSEATKQSQAFVLQPREIASLLATEELRLPSPNILR